ncbi:MAG: hypothetical protein OHK0029_05270 [Armatimonadaceae bacterium]
MSEFWAYVLAGFLAQIVDGALGMAFGITATSLLLTAGASPAIASATVHTAEVFTTGASAISHRLLGNVDRSLLLRLAVPGVIGAVVGSYLLASLPGDKLKPFIAVYLLFLGVRVLRQALKKEADAPEPVRHVGVLGFFGALLDAIGGGGWGPIVSSTLIARGGTPHLTIGTVNAAEFFVTLASSLTFLMTMGFQHGVTVLGLIIGGVVAAPLGAVLARRIPPRLLLALVGVTVIILSLRTLWTVALP